MDISYYRQLPVERLFEVVKGAAVSPPGETNWQHVSVALMEHIEEEKEQRRQSHLWGYDYDSDYDYDYD
jgi:hypothetical protein